LDSEERVSLADLAVWARDRAGEAQMSADHRWLVLRMEAPLLAFGGVAIDQWHHPGFPRGIHAYRLLANALGWQRTEWQAHQALQDRLVFGVRRDARTIPAF